MTVERILPVAVKYSAVVISDEHGSVVINRETGKVTVKASGYAYELSFSVSPDEGPQDTNGNRTVGESPSLVFSKAVADKLQYIREDYLPTELQPSALRPGSYSQVNRKVGVVRNIRDAFRVN